MKTESEERRGVTAGGAGRSGKRIHLVGLTLSLQQDIMAVLINMAMIITMAVLAIC